ncbi:MAG: histidine phosphatase family protein [Sarcina sp.]|nr:histidine phosphatase family protein [Sarcina sp.]
MSSAKTVYLIRHGRTTLQAEKRYQGITDAPLSAEGRAELTRAKIRPARVYVSPLCRARETASILFPQADQIVVPDLHEMDFGAFEGRNYMEMENDPDYRAWVDGLCLGPCPGGESRDQYCDRVCRAFGKVLSLAEKEGDDPVVIVAHGGTQMALLDRLGRTERTGDDENPGPDTKPDDTKPDTETPDAKTDSGAGENSFSYYSWQLPSGHGYLLETQPAGPGDLPDLRILEKQDFTKAE